MAAIVSNRSLLSVENIVARSLSCLRPAVFIYVIFRKSRVYSWLWSRGGEKSGCGGCAQCYSMWCQSELLHWINIVAGVKKGSNEDDAISTIFHFVYSKINSIWNFERKGPTNIPLYMRCNSLMLIRTSGWSGRQSAILNFEARDWGGVGTCCCHVLYVVWWAYDVRYTSRGSFTIKKE